MGIKEIDHLDRKHLTVLLRNQLGYSLPARFFVDCQDGIYSQLEFNVTTFRGMEAAT